MKLTFEVPLPPPEARGNNKPQTVGQMFAKRDALNEYALSFKYAAIDARNQSGNTTAWRKLQYAKMLTTFVFPDRRRRDIDNYMAAMKGCQDSLVAMGLLSDDSWTRLAVGSDVRVEKGASKVIVEVEAI